MSIEEKAKAAISQMELQLKDLGDLSQRGTTDEVSDKVDRWYIRAKKCIDTYISNSEAKGFGEFESNRIYSNDNSYLLDKVHFYISKVNVIIEELKRNPEALIDPSKFHVDSDDISQYDQFFKIFHPEISRVSKQKFLDKHYADSVESAFKEVNHRIKIFLRFKYSEEEDGVKLMRNVFALKTPKIELGDLKTESGRNMHEGYGHIFAGSILAIRNPKAHENISIDKNRAMHFLFLASLEMFKLDEAKVPRIN